MTRLTTPLALTAIALWTFLAGCVPMLVAGAAGTALVATDRRSAGAQVDDTTIETKVGQFASSRWGDRAHVSVTSYNGVVLFTGEVPDEASRSRVELALAKIENVKSVVNELAVAGNSSTGSRANDVQLGLKVKASYLDAKDLQANAVKVVVERASVYLMGRVTEREATRAAELASRVPGVTRVVRVFELIGEDELARLQPAPAPK